MRAHVDIVCMVVGLAHTSADVDGRILTVIEVQPAGYGNDFDAILFKSEVLVASREALSLRTLLLFTVTSLWQELVFAPKDEA